MDGTLTDPKLGITKSVAYALRRFDIEVENLDSLENFIGPPLKNSFMEQYNFSEAEANNAIKYYREYFDFVAGSELDGTRSDKAEVISFALSKNNIYEIGELAMLVKIFGSKKDNVIYKERIGT